MALSPATRLDGVRFTGTGITWQSYRWGELGYDQAAERAVITAARRLGSR